MAQQKNRGFTLVELVVTMVIIGILSMIAIPSFRHLTRSSEVISATNELVTALNVARTEAVTRRINVSVCMSTDQASCATTGNWDQGWIVYIGDTSVGEVLRSYSSPSPKVTMVGTKTRMTYAPSGYFSGVFNDTIQVKSNDKQINIITSANGRVRTEKI